MSTKAFLSLGCALLLTGCARTPQSSGIRANAEPVSLAGEWRITGQMSGRAFSFEGSMTLEVVGGQVTGEFRIRAPSERVGEVGGSYTNGYLILNGFSANAMANDCRGTVNMRISGAGARMSGEIEMSDGCSNRTYLGSIRMRRM